MSFKRRGKVITFYSYKGGTGRTMALANVACLLARRQLEGAGKGVLMIDWDLEAPGLHGFFRRKFRHLFGEAASLKETLDAQVGLIDLFRELEQRVCQTVAPDEEQSEEAASDLIERLELDRFILPTDIPHLSLLKAGRFDEQYATHVNTFQWEALYNRSPWLISAFAERLGREFRYILIDSRTGLSDISSICTMLMPERLVVVFTPTRQSLTGVLELIEKATAYRRNSDDLRPLVAFPLPSRIDMSEYQLHKLWRYGDGSEQSIIGYQNQFEELFKEVYDLPECNLEGYFNEVQLQHVSRYAYGEEIAVLVERGVERLSLARSYENFTERLVKLVAPWEEPNWVTFKGFDVLLAYNRADNAEVRAIAEELKQRGLKPWLDEEQIPPGRRVQDMIRQALPEIKSVAVFLGPDELATWERLELRAFISQAVEAGIPVIPVLLPGVHDMPDQLRFLKEWNWVRFKSSIDEVEALDKLEWGITGRKR